MRVACLGFFDTDGRGGRDLKVVGVTRVARANCVDHASDRRGVLRTCSKNRVQF